MDGLEAEHVHRVSDRTFLMHLKGKLEVNPTVPLKTRDDLSMADTPKGRHGSVSRSWSQVDGCAS